MITSWKIFLQDFVRVWKTRQVWVILIGLIITPALYSWINIAGFWDPYENTKNLKVAVVNEDKGASSEVTGHIDVGGQMVDKLHDNDGLGWQFMDREQADEAVKKGDVYASIIVPEDFSKDFISLFEGTYSQPTLEYHPNEKLNAISPKITDSGSATLDATISSSFNEQLANSVAEELKGNGDELSQKITSTSGKTADSFRDTADTVANSRAQLEDVKSTIEQARPGIDQARQSLGSVQTTVDDAQAALDQVNSISAEVQREVLDFAGGASDAYVQGTTALADGTASADATVGSVSNNLRGALTRVNAASAGAQGIVDQADQAINQLDALASDPALPPDVSMQLKQSLADLKTRNQHNRDVLGEINKLSDDSNATIDSLNKTTGMINDMAANTRNDSQALRDNVANGLPQLNAALAEVNATTGKLNASLESQKTLVGETDTLLGSIDEQLTHSQEVIDRFGGDLDGIEEGLRDARTDVMALSNTANNNSILKSVKGLDPEDTSAFLASPVEMESHAVFPVDHYGSGMSSLFINLTLWIGAFMLLIIFRAEVDPRGREDLTLGKAYFARFLFLASFAIPQALIVSIGNLVMGVEHVNAFAYVATAVLVGLCFLSITYSLISTFGHVGRGICVVIAFIQIPGASGLYPIEMTPDFFRAVHPFLPFSYGIGAMRETVGGFYGDHYVRNLFALIGMALIAYWLGALLRRVLSNVNMLVNDELRHGGLVINEQVHLVGSRYSLTDLLYALSDRDAYQQSLDSKWSGARKNYSQLMKITIAVGLALILGLGIYSHFRPGEKAIAFGLAGLVTLIAVGIICSLEYIKQSIAHDTRLADLSDEEIQEHLRNQREHPKQYMLEDPDDSNEFSPEGSPDATKEMPAVDNDNA